MNYYPLYRCISLVKASKIGSFMAGLVNDSYTEAQGSDFISGLDDLMKLSRSRYGKSFIDSSIHQIETLSQSLRKDLKNSQSNIIGQEHLVDFFSMDSI